jgi:hypothetical protein
MTITIIDDFLTVEKQTDGLVLGLVPREDALPIYDQSFQLAAFASSDIVDARYGIFNNQQNNFVKPEGGYFSLPAKPIKKEKAEELLKKFAKTPQKKPEPIAGPPSKKIVQPPDNPKKVDVIIKREEPVPTEGGYLQYDVNYAEAIDRIEKDLAPGNKETKLSKAFDKEIAYIIEPKGPARITIFPENGGSQAWLKIGLFFLEGANEYDRVRYQVKKTQGGDILYFFGKETNIWSYSARTVHGARSSDLIIDEKNQTVSTKDWYSDLRTHLGKNMGQPTHNKAKHLIRLEYNNFIRDGYLLDITYRKASHSAAIPIQFTMAIKRAITKRIDSK